MFWGCFKCFKSLCILYSHFCQTTMYARPLWSLRRWKVKGSNPTARPEIRTGDIDPWIFKCYDFTLPPKHPWLLHNCHKHNSLFQISLRTFFISYLKDWSMSHFFQSEVSFTLTVKWNFLTILHTKMFKISPNFSGWEVLTNFHASLP